MLKYRVLLKSINLFTIPLVLFISCNENTPGSNSARNGSGMGNGGSSITVDWLIPVNQVLDGGPGKGWDPCLGKSGKYWSK